MKRHTATFSMLFVLLASTAAWAASKKVSVVDEKIIRSLPPAKQRPLKA